MIKIVPKFNKADIRRVIEEKIKQIDEAVLMALQRAGERFVKNARSTNTYKDQTGNLRSSIGYVILKNGAQIVDGGFVVYNTGGEGARIGKKIIDQISKEYGTGYVLICIAGMDYAAAVESKGYDVITGSSKIAEADLKKAIGNISKKLSSKK